MPPLSPVFLTHQGPQMASLVNNNAELQSFYGRRLRTSSSFSKNSEWSDPGEVPLETNDSFEDDILFFHHDDEQPEQYSPKPKQDAATQHGVEIPEFMQSILGGLTFVPFLKHPPQQEINHETDEKIPCLSEPAQEEDIGSLASTEPTTPEPTSAENADQMRIPSGSPVLTSLSSQTRTNESPPAEVDSLPNSSSLEDEEEEEVVVGGKSSPQPSPLSQRPIRRLLASINTSGNGSPIIGKGSLIKRFHKKIQSARKNRQNNHSNNQISINSISESETSCDSMIPTPHSLSTSNTSHIAADISLLRKQTHNVAVRAGQLETLLAQAQKTVELLDEARQTQVALEQIEAAALAVAHALIQALQQPARRDEESESETSSPPLEQEGTAMLGGVEDITFHQADLRRPIPLRNRTVTAPSSFARPPRSWAATADGALHKSAPTCDTQTRERIFTADEGLLGHPQPLPPPQQQQQQLLSPYGYRRSTSWAYPATSKYDVVEEEDPASDARSSVPEDNPMVVSHNRRGSNSLPVAFLSEGTPDSFLIRANDLELPSDLSCASTESHEAAKIAFPDNRLDGLYPLVEKDGCSISLDLLEQLFEMGLAMATHDSDAFQPIWETQRMIKQGKCCCKTEATADWPYAPWYESSSNEDVVVWTQNSKDAAIFGSDWPMVKARARVRTRAPLLLEFLLDSSKVKAYNKMCQGRDDVAILFQDKNTVAKVMRALNKPKMSPKTFEMVSLCYARPLSHTHDAFMIVHRSVWEPGTSRNILTRSEMVLGVHLIRPCGDDFCELTTVTHVVTPNVPELLAKRAAPNSAATLVREIQALFLQSNC